MIRLQDAARYVRSKNAGPFWVTFDIFFTDAENFKRYHEAPELADAAIAALYGVTAASVRRFPVPSLSVLKISIPRAAPQGGELERDMHSGQLFVRLLDLRLSPS